MRINIEAIANQLKKDAEIAKAELTGRYEKELREIDYQQETAIKALSKLSYKPRYNKQRSHNINAVKEIRAWIANREKPFTRTDLKEEGYSTGTIAKVVKEKLESGEIYRDPILERDLGHHNVHCYVKAQKPVQETRNYFIRRAND